jgi:maleylacetoacetate isomerase
MSDIILYDYWRSSSSYRLRIALNLLGLSYKTVAVNLLDQEQKSAEHLERNPQGLVPVLEIDGRQFTQSLAILDYLRITRGLFLYPDNPIERAKTTALAHVLAVDVHPVCNLGVLTQLTNIAPDREHLREDWITHFISNGLNAFEALLSGVERSPFIGGNNPGLADICLIPQLYNADRWKVDYSNCHKIIAISKACAHLDAFIDAKPEKVSAVS